MIKTFIKYLAYKFYLIGKFEAVRLANEQPLTLANLKLIKGENVRIDKIAVIQNTREDDKLIIGSKTHIKGHLVIFRHGGEIKIGDSCFVGENTKIWSAKKITIGNRVLISHNVNIHDNISHPLNSKERHLDFDYIFTNGNFREQNDLREEEIIIEDDVWIGFNSTIMKGVTIGQGAIIGACSIVTQDVPPYAVFVGNPGRIIKYVE